MLDSLTPVDPTDQAPTHALFGIASEEAPVANRTSGAPEQPGSDATFVRHQLVAEIPSERNQLRRCLDPRGGRDGAVALRGGRQVDGVHGRGVDGPVLGCGHGPIMPPATLM